MKIIVTAMSIKAKNLVETIEKYEDTEKGFGRELAKDAVLYDIATMYSYMKRLKTAVNAFKGKDPDIPDDVIMDMQDEANTN